MDRRRFLLGGAALCACPLFTGEGVCAAAALVNTPADPSAPPAGPGASGESMLAKETSPEAVETSSAAVPQGVAPSKGEFDAGDVAAFAAQGIHGETAATHGFFLVRRGSRLFAPSATCTHQGAPLSASGSRIVCARHGSLFNDEGAVRKGPARIPLPRFAISLDEQNHVIVDTSVSFPRERWGDSGAYLELGAG